MPVIFYPATAIGINLPNANWIRAHHGSKSVTIGNITDAYNKAAHGNGFNEEFVYSDAEIKLIDTYADLTVNFIRICMNALDTVPANCFRGGP